MRLDEGFAEAEEHTIISMVHIRERAKNYSQVIVGLMNVDSPFRLFVILCQFKMHNFDVILVMGTSLSNDRLSSYNESIFDIFLAMS